MRSRGQRSSKMAADGGVMFWGGQPLTSSQGKRIAGSRWRLIDGSVFFGGYTADQEGKRSRAQCDKQRRDCKDGCWKLWLLMTPAYQH